MEDNTSVILKRDRLLIQQANLLALNLTVMAQFNSNQFKTYKNLESRVRANVFGCCVECLYVILKLGWTSVLRSLGKDWEPDEIPKHVPYPHGYQVSSVTVLLTMSVTLRHSLRQHISELRIGNFSTITCTVRSKKPT